MSIRVNKCKNQALLSFLFVSTLLFVCIGTALGQICDGTQYRTDDRGLVYLRKGEKAKLLIGGIWYLCEGCSPSIPISNENTQPMKRSRPTRQQRQQQQELTDEQIIEMIERTKALTSQVKSEDKARLLVEHYAFSDRLSLLARDLQSLEAESLPQFRGLKLKLKDLAEQATTIQEMGNIAHWSLNAALGAFSGESAREKAGWGFDEWKKSSGVMDFSQLTMEVPLPEKKTPQYLAFKYIADWASDMYTKILRLSERRSEIEKKGWDLKINKKHEPIPLTSKYAEEEKKREEQRADLEKQAQALLEEAKQMEERALEYVKEVSKMEKEFFELKNDPSKSSEFLERHGVKK